MSKRYVLSTFIYRENIAKTWLYEAKSSLVAIDCKIPTYYILIEIGIIRVFSGWRKVYFLFCLDSW